MTTTTSRWPTLPAVAVAGYFAGIGAYLATAGSGWIWGTLLQETAAYFRKAGYTASHLPGRALPASLDERVDNLIVRYLAAYEARDIETLRVVVQDARLYLNHLNAPADNGASRRHVITVEDLERAGIPIFNIESFYIEFGYELDCGNPPEKVNTFSCNLLFKLLPLRVRLPLAAMNRQLWASAKPLESARGYVDARAEDDSRINTEIMRAFCKAYVENN